MNIPNNLLFSKDHEWLRIEGDTAYIGITDFAQQQLGDIVFVEVNDLGDIEAGEVFGTVEAVKTVSDLLMPISATIVEFNSALEDNPELINQDPYGEGWIIKIDNFNDADKSELLSAEDYKKLIEA
ncbi:MAG: glycine cleavage system protein GcvH [Lentimicrobiaceae bacterium]|nr:glycine cleavage system protein GcvH [Lentimicrobiaceae bacterium]